MGTPRSQTHTVKRTVASHTGIEPCPYLLLIEFKLKKIMEELTQLEKEMLKHLEMVVSLKDLILYPEDIKEEFYHEAQAVGEMVYLIEELIKRTKQI